MRGVVVVTLILVNNVLYLQRHKGNYETVDVWPGSTYEGFSERNGFSAKILEFVDVLGFK